MVWTTTGVAAISVCFAAMQTGSGSFYLYEATNFGDGPGFFANSNHQGSFLLATLALWSCWSIGEMRAAGGFTSKLASTQSVQGGITLLLAFAVIVSGSLACQLLLAPVLAALLVAIAVIAGFASFLVFGPAANDPTDKSKPRDMIRI